MTIQLTERAVTAMISTLQANLPAELTAIETEFGDGVSLPAPANAEYYNRPKSEISDGDAHVEVFEDAYEFRDPYSDHAADRVSFNFELTVRLTFHNRNAETPDVMMTRMRRYNAALVRVVKDNIQLGAGPEVQTSTITASSPYWEIDGEEEETYQKVRTAVTAEVWMEECSV